MSEEINRLALSKKGQRQMTAFTGNELLYDYLVGSLDDDRKKSVEAHLENSREAQQDLQKIQIGLQYAQKLNQVTLTSALHAKLATPSSYFSVLFRKSRFDQWPVGLKWGLEALVVVFVIVTFLSLAPWEKVMNLRLATSSNDVVLSELTKATPISNSESDIPTVRETPPFSDEGLKPREKAAARAAVVEPIPTLEDLPEKAVAKAVAKAVIDTEESTDAEEHSSSAKSAGGFLYRGKIAVTNLDAIAPKIKDKILELGGRKAGEVDLGWRKTQESAYFHFTIPVAKYEELNTFLSGYGAAKLEKEKHPRVMPDGIIRLIITVDEASQ